MFSNYGFEIAFYFFKTHINVFLPWFSMVVLKVCLVCFDWFSMGCCTEVENNTEIMNTFQHNITYNGHDVIVGDEFQQSINQ